MKEGSADQFADATTCLLDQLNFLSFALNKNPSDGMIGWLTDCLVAKSKRRIGRRM